MVKKKEWIQEAIKKPGALIDWVKRNVGNKGFTERGTIKRGLLNRIVEGKSVIGKKGRRIKPGKVTVSRARLALKLKGFRKSK